MGRFGRMMGAESPIMSFLTKVADLLALNVLTLICSIPIFTIGASLTAMYTITGRIARGEDYYVFKDFFKAFKKNFLQATAEWLLMLLIFLFLAFDIFVMISNNTGIPRIMLYLLITIAILFFIEAQFLFPVQSRFVNPVKKTIHTTIMMSTAKLPKAVLMAMCWSIPAAILVNSPKWLPLFLFFGVSAPGMLQSLLYTPVFKEFEPEEEELPSDIDFRVNFGDEEDEDNGEKSE